jgi:hypothetical protein
MQLACALTEPWFSMTIDVQRLDEGLPTRTKHTRVT